MEFLELRQVSFYYPCREKPAVDGVNLNFNQEEITAIVGPNGSGKTTLTKLMMGLVHPAHGEVYMKSQPLQQYSLAQIGRNIGYVFQNPVQQLFCNTVEEEIGFGLKYLGDEPGILKQKIEFYLDYFELSPYRDVFPLHLSYGEKQRVAIAAVLAVNPDYFILDEPTVGLDAYRKRMLENYLKKIVQLGKGMTIVSHDDIFVQNIADRIINFENGKVQSDRRPKGNTLYDA